jgi:hypothetical protein
MLLAVVADARLAGLAALTDLGDLLVDVAVAVVVDAIADLRTGEDRLLAQELTASAYSHALVACADEACSAAFAYASRIVVDLAVAVVVEAVAELVCRAVTALTRAPGAARTGLCSLSALADTVAARTRLPVGARRQVGIGRVCVWSVCIRYVGVRSVCIRYVGVRSVGIRRRVVGVAHIGSIASVFMIANVSHITDVVSVGDICPDILAHVDRRSTAAVL